MASSQSTSTLPQGFSVYQPTLGAQLQFFPALGTQQLDDLINAFIPGPAAANEKRATISLDFLEYAQMTGQTFKFYPVQLTPSAAGSPATASPSLDSVSSSFNVSPVTSSWDWSAASTAPSAASSSRTSTKARRHSKATTSSPSSRHQTTDFSSLPGMKILTKDGLDVTNAASRGSKTKEQRDHAHLMRIIKACDSCKRKKIRCDPSHKKRSTAAVVPAQALATPKPAKKARAAIAHAPPPAVTAKELVQPSLPFDLDSSFSFSALESLDATMPPYDPFEEFMQFPPMDETPDFDFDLFVDNEDYISSLPNSSASSSSASPQKSFTPSSSQGLSLAPPGAEQLNPELQERNAQYPFLDANGSASDYTDFNLYSPQSSFSEDERMQSIGSSTDSLRSLSASQFVGGDGLEPFSLPGGPGGTNSDNVQYRSAGDSVGGNEQAARVQSGGDSAVEYRSSLHSVPGTDRLSQVVICCPPGGTVVLSGNSSTAVDSVNNVPTSFSAPFDSVSIDIRAAESPGAFVDQSGANATAGVSHSVGSESSVAYVESLGAPTSASGRESSAVYVQPLDARSSAVGRESSVQSGEFVANAMSDSAIRRSTDSPSAVADQNHMAAVEPESAASPVRDSSSLSASNEHGTTQRAVTRESSPRTEQPDANAEIVISSENGVARNAAVSSAVAKSVNNNNKHTEASSTMQSDSSVYSPVSAADAVALMSSAMCVVSYQLSAMYLCATVATAAMQYVSVVGTNDGTAPMVNVDREIIAV